MNKNVIAIAAALLGCAVQAAPPGPPPGGRYVGPPGYWGGGYRPPYPAWRAGYWGPRAGIYVGGPGYYWGAWPYGWGAAYAVPYAVPYPVPQVVPQVLPQVVVQQPVAAPEAPAASYWYYCTQPAGYYPYVQNCSQPWMRVVPQVPSGSNVPPQLAP